MRIVYEEDKIVYEPRFMELKLDKIYFYDNAEDVRTNSNAYIIEFKSNEDAEFTYNRMIIDGFYFVKDIDDKILSYDYPYYKRSNFVV